MNVITGCFIVLGIFGSISCALVVLLFNVVGQVTAVNKQLLIFLAGREGKPEQAGATMRALVATSKPPQGKLRGIADKKKKDDKPKNTNYTLEVGVH